MTNWLVSVDDGVYSSYAFNYCLQQMDKKLDHLYILHVMGERVQVYVGYATSSLLHGLSQAEEQKAKKILVHYGHRAKLAGVAYTMMKGTENNPGALVCKAVKHYNIDNAVVGRRGLGGVERFFMGSTSKYIVENAECNVIVIKNPVGPEEEHANVAAVIQAEEEERLQREEVENEQAEEHADKRKVLLQEEIERAARIQEEKKFSKNRMEKMFSLYQFKDELLKGKTLRGHHHTQAAEAI